MTAPRLAWLSLLLLALGAGPHLDLPVKPPRSPYDPPELLPPPAEEGEDEDPRDTPPPTFYGEEIDAESDELIYVLDISGSMAVWDFGRPYVNEDGQQANGPRWDRARAECIRSIRGLAESFRFSLVLYNCSTSAWSVELVEASAENKAAAVAWLRNVNWVQGGTGTGPGTVLGLGFGARNVILLTDGEPNCGAAGTEGHRRMIAAGNTQGARIDVFGIDARGQWRAFCQAVAADSGGRYVDVP